MARDLIAERKRLAKGKPVVVKTAELTDLELHLIMRGAIVGAPADPEAFA